MNPLPSIASASASSNIADLFTRPLPPTTHHRYTQLGIGNESTATAPTTSVVSPTVNSTAVAPTVVAKATILSNDPYTLITGEDTTSSVDLSSSDLFDSDSEIASAFEVLEVREFRTATLIFISYPHSELKPTILLEPIFDHFDWLDWVPLPRLILPESYFHIFGLDYLQAFALCHLFPIWIYSLLHFGLE